MIKEFIIAIILGTLIGFGVSGLLVTTNKKPVTAIPKTADTTTPPISSPTPDSPLIATGTASSLTINTPKNESVVSSANITLKGTAPASSLVVVTTLSDSFQALADDSGNFSVNVSLIPGANILKIKSVSPDDSQFDTEILVTYSTVKLQ